MTENKSEVTSHVIWNLGSFGFLAVTGIAINLVIGRQMGPAALGSFNQVFALLIFGSQISVLGIHFSVLKRVSILAVADEQGTARKIGENVTSALLVVLAISAAVSVVGFAMTPLIGWLFDSEDVARGWLWVVPALVFFSLNKVLLNSVNGVGNMRAFAALQALRYAAMAIGLLLFLVLRLPAYALPAIITGAEATLFGALIGYVYRLAPLGLGDDWRRVAREHISFGFRGALGGTLAEMNTRVDVLILGIFVGDKQVGIYSIAALVVEAMFLTTIVFRNIVNPRLARDMDGGRLKELSAFLRHYIWLICVAMAVASIAVYVSYPVFVRYVLADTDYLQAHSVLAILLAGLTVASGYALVDMLLIQGGRPGMQTVYKLIVVATNVVLNFALVPVFGMVGAAVGTAGAFLASVVAIKLMARRYLSVAV